MTKRVLVLLTAVLFLPSGLLFAQRKLSSEPVNLQFEESVLNDSLRGGWFTPPKEVMKGYTVSYAKKKPYKEKQCIEIASNNPAPGDFGNIMQTIDATPYRGKTVIFSAAVRAEPSPKGGRAQLWMRVDRTSGEMGFFDNMDDRPVTSKEWKIYEIRGKVDTDAQYITFGCLAIGEGKAFVDYGSFVALNQDDPRAIADYAPPKKLSERELANLIAFAKLYGYIRYFYPSDECANANWDNLAINGVKYVESAASDAELASRLNQFFSPLAPLAHVLPSGAIPPPIGESEIYPPHPLGRIAWYHSGVGMPGAAGAQSQIYTSKRIVQDGRLFTKDALAASGGFYETISANGLRGKKIHFSIATKCDGAQGQGITVWVEPIIAGGGAGETAMGVVLSTSWQRSAVTATIPATADSIRFGTSLRGGGAMWLDDAELVADGSKKNLARDPGFELADHTMSSAWRSASSQFYIESIDHHDPASGEHSGKVQLLGVDKKYLAHFPSSDSLMKLDLGGGVAVRMPYALWLNEYGLLSGSHTKPMDSLDRMFVPSGGDRFVRLADIVIAWNVFRHFYPYFDVTKTDWTAELPEALAEASEAPDKEHFQRALQKMVAKLHDGHGNVFGGKKRNLVAPFQCRLIEGQIAVTATADQYKGNIRRGDIITSINGIDALRLLDSTRTYVSSATRQWSDFKILSNLFETLDTDMFVITVKRAGNKTETITEKPSRRIGMINDKKTKPVEELKPGIMYVDLDRVTKQLFDSVTPDLAKAKAIIFDMRGYPRGILRESIAHCIDTAVGSAFWCVPQQFYPDQSDTMWDITSWSVEPAAPRFTKNIIHITDGRAISAAETYMGIIEAYHIGDIVGSPTAGTNGNINPFPLPGGYSISWTGMRVLKHDGSRHHGVGISPTINIEPTIKGIRDGKDEVLEKAIETAEKNMK